jgi:hypothetical protein
MLPSSSLSKQAGMANYAKALFSVPPPLLPLRDEQGLANDAEAPLSALLPLPPSLLCE